jgi:hypothetical protein
MSTKFNRNDANAGEDKFYIGDYKADLNGIEEDIREANKLLHQMPCIISGLVVTVNSGDDSLFDVSAGEAFDEDANIIDMPSAETAVDGADVTDDAINYICIRHKYSYDNGRAAYKTGTMYYSAIYDDYEIVVRTEAGGLQEGDVCLATSTGDGTGISVSTDNRTTPDFSGAADTTPPMKVTGVKLATGPEPGLIHSSVSAQLIDDHYPVLSYIEVTFNEVNDPSGIKEYQVELIPLDNSDDEQPEYLMTQAIKYAPTAPGGPEYTPV